MGTRSFSLHALDALFRPQSVAIIGASSDPNRIGGRPVAFSKRGYKGRIVPINPKGGELQGLPAYASITEAPAAGRRRMHRQGREVRRDVLVRFRRDRRRGPRAAG